MNHVKTFADSDIGGIVIGLVLVLLICGGFGLFAAYGG